MKEIQSAKDVGVTSWGLVWNVEDSKVIMGTFGSSFTVFRSRKDAAAYLRKIAAHILKTKAGEPL